MEEVLIKNNFEKLHKKLRRNVATAIGDYNMIEEGDKIMVCLSGGKDSYTMLDLLIDQQKVSPVKFDILAVNLDQKQPGYPEHILPEYLTKLGVDFKIIERDTYSIVMDKTPEGKTLCSMCSRLRRGTLYQAATDLGCNKLALGHHREDIIETMFLNIFFAGKMETMPAKLRTQDGKHVVIRPLANCKEEEIEEYSQMKGYPIIPCNLCGSQDNMQRQVVKKMLKDWEKTWPNRTNSIHAAMGNIAPSHMIDTDLFDFTKI
jgi:tRNA 2-thiocytidine biosynthesis protein TtcA